jgi:hypothetical protein
LRADRRRDLTPIDMFGAQASSNADKFNGSADECMAEYDLDCWKVPDLSDPGEFSYPVMHGISNRSLCERPLCARSGHSPKGSF